jgi:hypothetical protein
MRKIAECDAKLAQYRAALDSGASPATVAGWIAETEAEKARYSAGLRQLPKGRGRMTDEEIKAVVDKLADVARVLSTADANDKSEIFRQLGLRLTYQPGRRLVEARISPAPHGFFESVRGARPTNLAYRTHAGQGVRAWRCSMIEHWHLCRFTPSYQPADTEGGDVDRSGFRQGYPGALSTILGQPVVAAAGPSFVSWPGVFPTRFQPAQKFKSGQDGVNSSTRQTCQLADLQAIHMQRRFRQHGTEQQLHRESHFRPGLVFAAHKCRVPPAGGRVR